MAVEEVFELNGEWVIKTTCSRCEVEIHSPVGEEEPSEIVKQAAGAFRRVCDDCLDREERAREESARRGRVRQLVLESEMPESIRGYEFHEMIRSDPKRTRAIEACEAWSRVDWEKPGIYLAGPAGVGKTRLAATAAWAALNGAEPMPLRWCSIAQLMGNLNRTFKEKERRRAISVLLGEGPLVLDDFDKVNPTDFGRQQVFTAIDSRVQAGVPLIVTANLRLGEIGDRFGEPIMSRLAGHCTQFVLDGADRRIELDV